ncbi:hypothetical protein Ddc_06223 [Ditylenchus destructor]|nr:hypothetical protein Ddc_06223 [Ditylenchus destructor]
MASTASKFISKYFCNAKSALRLDNAISIVLYTICAICVLVNFYVLLNRHSDTIYYLRIYHLVVGGIMISCGVVMLMFMWKAHSSSSMLKLPRPHTIPRPTLISAFVLTNGVALGYAYFLVFNVAFSNCDKLIDATNAEEQWLEAIYNLLMVLFCLLTLVYILQRSYYGSLETYFDILMRRWVNVVLFIVWIKIVIFKGYLSYQELCQREEISGYWCPIIKRPYRCNPEEELKGTQKIWYYLHKGLLNSSVISCASEFYPVMLVAHWLACGRAEERADELIRRRQEKKSVRKMLTSVMGNVSQVYGIDAFKTQMPALQIQAWVKWVLISLAWTAVVVAILRWFVGFYFAIKFDDLHKIGSMTDDYMEFVASCAQLILFSLVYKWSLSVDEKRFDAHHRAEARGDLTLIFGSAAFMSVKLLLQILELNFQRADGFIGVQECIIRVISLTMIQMSEWLQLFCLRRIMALHFEDVHSSKAFLPSVALCSLMINWVCFGMTFFETNIIKYQLSKPDFNFSQATLISMIFTQTIYPADYLFTFTAAGCWMDVLLRYMEMGLFQLGKPCLETDDDGNGHPTPGEDRRRLSVVSNTDSGAHYYDPRRRKSSGNPLAIGVL